jgi:membrane associated rhomboid family serine protease
MSMLIPIRDINPTRSFPIVTLALIGINVVAFFSVAQGISIHPAAAFEYGALPCEVLGRVCAVPPQAVPFVQARSPLVNIFTSMFMHADIFHIGFNMLFLWVFGNNVEDRLGKIRFPLFYLACGVAAAFAHILVNPSSSVPTIGASGAVSGILGAYIVLWPGATIISLVPVFIFFFSVRTPAWLMIGLWFVVQLLGSAAGFGQPTGDGGGVAYLAHVGGFVAGLVLILVFGGRRKRDRLYAAEDRRPFGD